ncbi:nucleoside diphosphate kinase Ndk1 [Aspergillus melleus]|uniref:Nucleoside diphosphate kinase Ndk1 n=1 Tax=Aspergillus melleus TaxID=138277 RepID=A0ACC3B2G9_9EURO|nr:nucleoside diphosphate kinase Ndk1 [Aspergillus melleus]
MSTEQTFIAIKPDGVQRGLVGPILSRFENRGFKLVALKLTSPSKEHLEQHYADLSSKPFFPGLVSYMLSGPIVAMVWEVLSGDHIDGGVLILPRTSAATSATAPTASRALRRRLPSGSRRRSSRATSREAVDDTTISVKTL